MPSSLATSSKQSICNNASHTTCHLRWVRFFLGCPHTNQIFIRVDSDRIPYTFDNKVQLDKLLVYELVLLNAGWLFRALMQIWQLAAFVTSRPVSSRSLLLGYALVIEGTNAQGMELGILP